MGTRDFGHHETKKPKKGAKKPVASSDALYAPPPVEVIKSKGKKDKGFEEE